MALSFETPRLVIRSFEPRDAAALHARVFGDAETMKYIPRGASPSLDRTRASIDRFLRHEREHGFGLWAVELKETGELIGDCGLFLVQGVGPEVEVAYHFGRDWWGQGFATEAAAACLRYGFAQCDLTEIIAICFPDHAASRRVMEKAGMRYVGPARYYDLDLVKYEKRR
ncbi:MAG TPA: GNAT family N-acetyltransferase [Candidatus Limnocylindrales bacterium]|nr:GNAT family N-acetyltransferase [Candidatus Limnocylindrales bacterium]